MRPFLRPEAIATILRLTQQSAVQQESVTVYIGKKQEIIRMDYLHLPILNRKTTDLLVPINLQAESIFRETHSGTQSQFSERSRTELAGISMLYRRHLQTQELTPFWNGGGMASRRGEEESVDDILLEAGKDYYAHINLVTSEIHFYINILYNQNDARLKVRNLNLFWKSVDVDISKDLTVDNLSLNKTPSLCKKWHVFFEYKLVEYASTFHFKETDDIDEDEKEFAEKAQKAKENPESFVLGWTSGDLSYTKRDINRLLLVASAFNSESSTFSHEYGHMLNIIIDDSEINRVAVYSENGKKNMNPLFKYKDCRWSNEKNLPPSENFGEKGRPVMSYGVEGDDGTDKVSVWGFEYKIVVFRVLEYLAKRLAENNAGVELIGQAYVKRKPHTKFTLSASGNAEIGLSKSESIITSLSMKELQQKIILYDKNNKIIPNK